MCGSRESTFSTLRWSNERTIARIGSALSSVIRRRSVAPHIGAGRVGQQRRDRLDEPAIVGTERRRRVAVDVDLADQRGAADDRYDDLGPVSTLHARYLGSALTSSTTIVAFALAAAPQMPRASGMRV